MLPAKYTLPTSMVLITFMLGCGVQSKYNTRSNMTEEELSEIDAIYNPSEEVEGSEEIIIPEFLGQTDAPAISVNGREISSEDIRSLYMYFAQHLGNEDAMSSIREQYNAFPFLEDNVSRIQRMACDEWIDTYVAMTQWPETIDPALEMMNEFKQLVSEGTEFANLVVENSQEPNAEQSAGFVGQITTGLFVPIFEMHAYTDPVGEVSGPFPTMFGWHLIEITERDDESEFPIPQARHLILSHGLEPENSDIVRENLYGWRQQADIRILDTELVALYPELSSLEALETPIEEVPPSQSLLGDPM